MISVYIHRFFHRYFLLMLVIGVVLLGVSTGPHVVAVDGKEPSGNDMIQTSPAIPVG